MPDPEVNSTDKLQAEKLALEVEDLRNRIGFWAQFSSVLWPVVGGALTVVLGILTYRVAEQQATLAAQQGDLTKEVDRIDEANKHREILDRALMAATDDSAAVDRRIAGIWEIAGFWRVQDDEGVVANTLAAELLLTDDKYRFARCAAAEAIGDGIKDDPASFHGGSDEARSQRIAARLYGKSDGSLGVVSLANVFLSRLTKNPDKEEIAEHCLTPLAASKEAIRKNWEYLRDVNLGVTDLSTTELYSADLAGAVLSGANLKFSDFKCANLYGANFEPAHFQKTKLLTRYKGANFTLANVEGLQPKEVRKDLIANFSAVEMPDEEWQRWRSNEFRVNSGNRPSLDPGQGIKFPCGW
jgi:hypothetical protein